MRKEKGNFKRSLGKILKSGREKQNSTRQRARNNLWVQKTDCQRPGGELGGGGEGLEPQDLGIGDSMIRSSRASSATS